jgi:DNA adenine methylase
MGFQSFLCLHSNRRNLSRRCARRLSSFSRLDNSEERVLPLECSPFVKWAGGKTQLIGKLKFPGEFRRYYEPFLGGGAVFFHLATIIHPAPFPANLTDSNSDLILAYKTVRDRVEELIELLAEVQAEFRKLPRSKKPGYYYERRKHPPDPKDKVARTAWFIFLNKTGYNGLYRVNRKGIFNVPYGDYPNVTLCVPENLRNVSSLLSQKGTEITVSDYIQALSTCSEKDFVYLDPPYHPYTRTGFTDYTRQSFSEEDQITLASVLGKLIERGCKVLLSNSDTPFIRDLYEKEKIPQLQIEQLSTFRMINSVGSKRTGAKELVIRNYR